jgi:hypothetical protein
LSAKLVLTFVGRGSHVISVTDPYGRIIDFLDLIYYVTQRVKLLNRKIYGISLSML